MKMSQLVGRRIKETPRDAQTQSHILLIRGGYIRAVSTGVYSLLPLGKRIIDKIERIIREEMNNISAQEVLMPVVQPAELWQESGRYDSVSAELLRFKDRNEKDMVLAMTHEEATCHMIRDEINSYKQLPAVVYQIQTKYRDEARPRAGLIRVREFTMKDAYSFHTNQECLEDFYKQCHSAYERIFKRIGFKDVISIESDPGMIGGNVAHEFMAIADCGEDSIFVNEDGSYKANMEVASSKITYSEEDMLELEEVHTPDQKSIDDIANFLSITSAETAKAVFYSNQDNELIFAVIRGDFEVNETKLKNAVKAIELSFATDEQIRAIGAEPGYASILSIDPEKVQIVVDPTVVYTNNLVVGANKADYHIKHFNYQRDCEPSDKTIITDIAKAREGDLDPVYGKTLSLKRGIEVGNIFQLGTKYSETMNCNFLDQNGKSQAMIMGCYGIGVGRSMASVVEQCHDQYGPIWPFSIAPFEVHICALNKKKEGVGELADKIYADLVSAGIEVLYDDRDAKAGFAFNDADLIGIPYRLILSPKNMKNGQIEFKSRDGLQKSLLSIENAVDFTIDVIDRSRREYLEEST